MILQIRVVSSVMRADWAGRTNLGLGISDCGLVEPCGAVDFGDAGGLAASRGHSMSKVLLLIALATTSENLRNEVVRDNTLYLDWVSG